MHGFEIEDQIQLAHVVEKAVQGFYENLDEVEEGEGGFGGGAYQDEVEGCVVPVCDLGGEVGVYCGLGLGLGGGRGEERWEAVRAVVSFFFFFRLRGLGGFKRGELGG